MIACRDFLWLAADFLDQAHNGLNRVHLPAVFHSIDIFAAMCHDIINGCHKFFGCDFFFLKYRRKALLCKGIGTGLKKASGTARIVNYKK